MGVKIDSNFVDIVKQAFGQRDDYIDNKEPRIYYYLLNNELAECKTDGERCELLWKKIINWKNEYFLWADYTYIDGIASIFNLEVCTCCLCLPESEPKDWIEYLYHMSLVVVGVYEYLSEMSFGEIGDKYFMYGEYQLFHTDWYFVESEYKIMTSDEWLSEIEDIGRIAYNERYHGDNPKYWKMMKRNYPKYQETLAYLRQNISDCTVVKVNKFEDDAFVWYFAKTDDSLYVMMMLDQI